MYMKTNMCQFYFLIRICIKYVHVRSVIVYHIHENVYIFSCEVAGIEWVKRDREGNKCDINTLCVYYVEYLIRKKVCILNNKLGP